MLMLIKESNVYLPRFLPLPEEIMDDNTSIIAKSELSDNPAKVYLASLNSPVSRRSMYCAIKVLRHQSTGRTAHVR
jgi:hypothetical protein